MTSNGNPATQVREAIEHLIESGSTYNLEELERLYHRDLKIFIVDEDGNAQVLDRARNMEMFQQRRDAGLDPLNRWAEFRHIEAKDEAGFVIVTRKMELRGRPETFVLAIHLVREDERWQVVQETIFVRPQATGG